MSRRTAKGEYIETDTGNKVSRRAVLVGTQNIMLGGKSIIQPEAMIRGDLVRTQSSSSSSSSASGGAANSTAVAMGRYCFLSRGALLRPPGRLFKGYCTSTDSTGTEYVELTKLDRIYSHMPLRMGDHVFVGERTVVRAASIGSHVHIGRDVVVGEFAIIKDYVRVLDDTVVPPNMVIPSFTIVAGKPARVIGEVPEGAHESFELRDLYKTVGNHVQPQQQPQPPPAV